MSFKYKNVSGMDQSLDRVGLVKAGEEVTTEFEVNNANFELIDAPNEAAHIPVERPEPKEEPLQATASQQDNEEVIQ